MLGDDLKKSLEPIQVSDELLEKTRKAIEKARLEQAAASLNETSSVSRKASPRLSYFLKAAVPLACIVLVVGGLALLIPKFSKDSESTTKANRSKGAAHAAEATAAYAENTVAEHNEAANEVADMIDSELENSGDSNDDSKSVAAETTTTADIDPEASETEFNSEESQQSTEETDGQNKYLGPSPDVSFSDQKIAVAGDYIICIAEDGKSLYLRDRLTNEIIPESDEYQLPEIADLSENETITGLSYNNESKMLFMTVSDSSSGTLEQKIYACTFINGSSEGFTPVQVQEN